MRNSLPWGNAFIVGTPAIDRTVAMIQQEEKQRQATYQKSMQDLDKEFSKNVSGMRDADIGDLTKLWGEYKQMNMSLYKNGRKLSNEERIAAQLATQRKLGEAYSLIGKSKAEREPEELTVKGYAKDPNKFEDHTPQVLLARRNTPVRELEAKGLNDIFGLTQLQATDFSKSIVNAMGKENVRNTIQEVSPDGLTTTISQVKAYNSPREYKTQLQSEAFSNRKSKHLANQFAYDDQKANEIVQRYSELVKTPEFKAAYPNESEFAPEDMDTPLEKTAALMAMEHALLHPPTIIKGKPFNNTGAVMDKKASMANAEWDRRNKITFGQSMAKIAANKTAGEETDTPYLTDVVADKYGEDMNVTPYGGTSTVQRVIFVDQIDPEDNLIISGQDLSRKKFGVPPALVKDQNGKQRKAYYQDQATGDWIGAEGRRISRERVRQDVIDKKENTKIKKQSSANKTPYTPNKPVPSQKSTTPIKKGKVR